MSDTKCPHCGSHNLTCAVTVLADGTIHNQHNCLDCGHGFATVARPAAEAIDAQPVAPSRESESEAD